jgi:hypothetical protein
MTNAITDIKAQLATDLATATIEVLDYIPERLVPPIVVISSGSPYFEQANFTNDYKINLDLLLVAATAVNEDATEALDNLISDVVQALPSYANMQTVQKPYALAANNAEYLATTLSLELFITL